METKTPFDLTETQFRSCTGSRRLASQMAASAPFSGYDHAVATARDIWFNKIDVNSWLEAFAAHPEIGSTKQMSQQCLEEQSTAFATATNSALEELSQWNVQYKKKFGFLFLICAAGRSTPEILEELKKRYPHRPIVELEIAAEEELKIFELRLAKLFDDIAGRLFSPTVRSPATKLRDRTGILGNHFLAIPKASGNKTCNSSGNARTRPPITTHILDVSRGSPASDVEVHLEMWKGSQRPSLSTQHSGEWVLQGSSVTNADGRSGQLMSIVDDITPGVYRISFNTGKYIPFGFFPYVSIVFEVKESQKSEHFHVPLLLSPFSFSTYRGS